MRSGIDKIIVRIKSDAEAEAQRIKADAKRKAKKILDEAKREAEQESSIIDRKGEKEIETIVNKIRSGARMSARRIVMRTRDQIISQCFTKAKKDLSDLTKSKKYETVLKRLITDGVEVIGLDEVIVISNKKDREIVKKVISNMSNKGVKISMSKEGIDTIGGAIVRSKSGDVSMNNTFEARLERQKNDLRHGVSKILHTRE